MTPTEYYQKLTESDQILLDRSQQEVVSLLQVIFDHLLLQDQKQGLIQQMLGKRGALVPGLYLWGEVGVGKTFLVDSFFYCLPFKNKLRIHFHKFMNIIHEQMSSLKGQTNPLIKVAKKIANENKVICFDELLVTDIADAMLLATLFKTLYEEKTCLLFTSNTAPDNLYLKGIQRDSFLPAIELIKKNSTVIQLSSQTDYRFRNYQGDNFYYTPLNSQAEAMIEKQFRQSSHNQNFSGAPIRILERDIRVKKAAAEVVWFDFRDICGVPRSQNDYLDIVKQFDTIFVTNLKVIHPEQNDLARSFINLVDVLYDAHKKLIISAEKPIEEIYYCGRLLFEFARTRSRIKEMQTRAWQEFKK